MPPASTKARQRLEPISYDELLSNAGMSGFVSFLEHDTASAAAAPGATPVSIKAHLPELVKTGRTARRSRLRRAHTAEDGHSLAEQAVYEALWGLASPLSDVEHADRTVRIGYHRLGLITRLSWVSVKANLRSLEKKLAIEVIASENSATQEGKGYRVYSRAAILERRKRAGLEWVRRTRGVELLTHAAVIGNMVR